VEEVGVRNLNPAKYGELCAAVIPKIIANDREFERLSKKLEELAFKETPTTEETALAELLAKLVQDYDDRHHELPDAPPHEVMRFLMEQRGLRQADLLPIFDSRSVASDVINGKREPSKAHIRKLAEFFRVPADVFI
jgi:HTH-type transcriptional regulator/antitoxin HigA